VNRKNQDYSQREQEERSTNDVVDMSVVNLGLAARRKAAHHYEG